VTTLPVVGVDAVDGIAALCSRAVAQPLSADDLRGALFAPDQPSVVRFDPAVGVVATVRSGDNGSIRLLAVDPDARGRGHGRALVEAAEADLEGVRTVTVGADPPYFLFPGVPVSETGMCSLLEARHYAREEANFNVVVDLDDLGSDPGVGSEPAPGDRAELERWMTTHWSNWSAEVSRAFDRGTLLVTRDHDGIAAFCAYDVNRPRTLGPIAVRPDLMGHGAGRLLLETALHRMRARGYETIEVVWVGPLAPYARVGGRIGSVFFVYRRRR